MANTVITLTSEQGILVPSQPSVPVNSGDSVTFRTGDGSAAYLFFSPAATTALSPNPTSPTEVSSGATFEFISSLPGAYSVYFETDAGTDVPVFPVASSNLLMLEVDPSGASFGNVDNRTRG